MTEKASNNTGTVPDGSPSVKPKMCPITKVIRPGTPPGTLRMAHCPECKGNYYGSEAEHRARFHGEPYEMYK